MAPVDRDRPGEAGTGPTPAPTPSSARPRLRTTLAVALADEVATARIVTVVEASSDIEVVASTTDASSVGRIARDLMPDVLLVGADLIAADDAAAPTAAETTATVTTGTGDAPSTPRSRPPTDFTHPVAIGLRALCGAVDADLPAIRIIVVAPEGVSSYGAVLGGAIGCIPPTELVDRIVDATRRVAWGEGLLTPEWARAVLHDLGNRAGDRKESGPLGRPALTATELEVLRRTANGASATAIAAHHSVPERDVNRNAAYALVKAHRLHADQAIAESA